ncbi:hypothetical protein GPL17_33200 [Bradyrhizobium yuanmingense]|uniref:hypothetical protein n=1 Tax=Bradyrhizobium yuanmingense TaxID=108015 RepID=UPI0012F70A85|nr:hypothetical protein [Bradyrhizobium yuanmingense]MVT55291.1 hypothetical protein [Bradyrhizobium yuanmingense]
MDQFSPRAQDYNHQTASSKSNQILLNVVRSAYSQPLQFTDVSTVAGTASVSGTLGETIPFPLNIAARTGSRSITASPSVTGTGASTVNIANLNTQEFYQGLQKPLSKSQIAYYLFSGFYDLDPYTLLPLFISEIEVTDGTGKKFVLRNRGTSQQSFARFYFATAQLIKGGLRTEPAAKAKPTKVGPLLSEDEAKDPKLLSALVTSASSSSGSSGGGSGLTLSAVSSEKNGEKQTNYQLQREGGSGGEDQFCFADIQHPQGDLDLSITGPLKSKEHTIYLGLENGRYVWPVTVPPSQYCGHSAGGTAGRYRILFKTRSLEEIFYFLGQIVRTELGLAGDTHAPLGVPFADGHVFHLFRVERRLPIGDEPWTMINGQVFVIRIDPSGKQDASSRVLQLLTDLLALQSSAKNFPAPNLIAIAQ